MDKYDKHKLFNALVLEIQASLYLNTSDAIFVSKFCPFFEAHKLLKNKRVKFVFLYAIQHNTVLSSKTITTGKTKTFLFSLT